MYWFGDSDTSTKTLKDSTVSVSSSWLHYLAYAVVEGLEPHGHPKDAMFTVARSAKNADVKGSLPSSSKWVWRALKLRVLPPKECRAIFWRWVIHTKLFYSWFRFTVTFWHRCIKLSPVTCCLLTLGSQPLLGFIPHWTNGFSMYIPRHSQTPYQRLTRQVKV